MSRTARLALISISILGLGACRAIIGAEESTLVTDGGAGTSAGGNGGTGGAGGTGAVAGQGGSAGGSGDCTEPLTKCGDACINVWGADADNCGWCHHKCLGQPCTDGFCKAVQHAKVIAGPIRNMVLVPGLQSLFFSTSVEIDNAKLAGGGQAFKPIVLGGTAVALAASDKDLFWIWTDSGGLNPALHMASPGTLPGTPQQLAPINPSILLTVGQGICAPYVFWAEDVGAINRIKGTDSPGAPESMLAGAVPARAITNGNGRLYFSAAGNVDSVDCTMPGSPPDPAYKSSGDLREMAFSNEQNRLLMADWAPPGAVISASVDGSQEVDLLATEVGQPVNLFPAGPTVFFANKFSGEVFGVDFQSFDLRHYYPPGIGPVPSALAADGEWLYMAVDNQVLRVPR
ncbi:MAG: hypothetical protein HY898_32120 [Deltaproteobacteria bacterium]|nr:hypothetical protein [Deltaproteobacteria bacterium]